MADSVDPNARYVAPEGVALAIFIVSPTFLALSYLTVVTRAYVRITEKAFNIDDMLLIAGLVSSWATIDELPFPLPDLVLLPRIQIGLVSTPALALRLFHVPGSENRQRRCDVSPHHYEHVPKRRLRIRGRAMGMFYSKRSLRLTIQTGLSLAVYSRTDPVLPPQCSYTADVGLAMHAVAVGVGTVDSRLNAWMDIEAMKYFTIWILVYVVGLALIKSSICTTIWRISSVRHSMRVTVYFLFGLVWASFLVTFVGMLLYCSPIRANWDTSLVLSGKGKVSNS